MGEIEFFHHFSYNKKVWLTKTSHTEVAIRITYCLLCDGLIIFCSRYIVRPCHQETIAIT